MMHLQWFTRDWFAGDSRASSSCPLLLTTGNPEAAADRELMGKLGLRPA